MEREIGPGDIRKPELFLGDSRYDQVAAAAAEPNFLFMGSWSKFDSFPGYLKRKRSRDIGNLRNLVREL